MPVASFRARVRHLRIAAVLSAVVLPFPLLAACASRPVVLPRTTLHVVYAVTDETTQPPTPGREVVDVDPPYRGRSVSEVDGRSVGGFVWSENGLYTIGIDGTVRETQPVPPGFPGPDGHLDVALPVAARLGLVAREPGVTASAVAGRPCTMWLSRDPLDGGTFAPATASDRTETCVGTDGLLLSDRWTSDGRLVRLRTATSVTRVASLAGTALFDGTTPSPVPSGFSPLDVTAPGADVRGLLGSGPPRAPAGLALDRVVATRSVDRTSGTPQLTGESAVMAYTGGGRLAVLAISHDLPGPTPPPFGGSPVDLGALGRGLLSPVYTGLRIQVLSPGGLLVTVTADLPEAALLTWVRGLTSVPALLR